MEIITAEEKVRELAPSSRLLARCVEALRASDHLGAIVKLEDSDRDKDIDLVSTALYLAGWRVETVAEYPPGRFSRSESGNQIRIGQRITGAVLADAGGKGEAGH